ncbi:MAG TPA: tetratricopeptide repeat protein [Gemmatimonadaceae bacterium]|nr:tetratricopeptide repeat protein [Gemmatimonadaceae bacterium]
MTGSRLDAFRRMVEKSPNNALARFGLANEALKAGDHALAAEQLTAYLALYDDEGNGWLRLGDCLSALGRRDESRAAYEKGIAAAERYGHSGMAEELRARLQG